jgi:hypothetical protein
MLTDFRLGLILAHDLDGFIHELSHIICDHAKHDHEFCDVYTDLGGESDIIYDSLLDRHLGTIGFAANVGNVTGIQNILTDFHLLQAYRKFSQRILGTEGQWEFKGDRKIRLFPTPRGSFPVFVEYIPHVNHLTSPTSREIIKRALVAEAKIMIGNIRSKFGNIPAPDGGNLSLNGEQMRTEGQAEKEKAEEDARKLDEPLGIYTW